ncbi:hypothetical protein IQ66_12155 [Leptospira borgpetersenii serovar Ballum]|uniref:Uncharacterized protein n=1 Tax=Leptospira borgpetersenii str. Brem 328 TaxID=1049780 RepID=A0ABC9SJP4_LEPBO|nr:hypothetical protein LEP1GSC056_0360 [Leptospira borgpetersenii str. Brem 328]KGE23482.1 hypothetical protein IQ66_12155 [Leptospira borgpetersenii serovar Ballum]
MRKKAGLFPPFLRTRIDRFGKIDQQMNGRFLQRCRGHREIASNPKLSAFLQKIHILILEISLL